LPEVTRDELPQEALPNELPIEVREHEILIVLGDRRWRVRGLSEEIAGSLKVNLLVARGERFHVDTLDLYSARSRAVYVAQTVSELGLAEETVKRDLGAVLLKLEALQAERVARPVPSPGEKMTLEEKAEALALLRDPRLTDRILADLSACGIVGEETNKLVAYLGALSRKLDAPLALVIQSLSGAGKSALMDAVLELMPEEERLHYSAMTGQSLFYLGGQDLRNKILAIAEEAGVREAAYALKLLQSAGARGFTTRKGRSRRCAFRCSCCTCRRVSLASSPSSVCATRCLTWIARVCSRDSFTVSTRHRLASSSSRSIAVVVRNSITGPSTRYVCVTSLPVTASFPVEAIVSSPALCRSFSA
jgi:hypothetical protein